MKRIHVIAVALALLALMAVAGLLGSGPGLLMVSPFLTLLLPLLAGLYPGQRVLDGLIDLLDPAGRRRREPGRLRRLDFFWRGQSVRIAGSIGSRGPPALPA